MQRLILIQQQALAEYNEKEKLYKCRKAKVCGIFDKLCLNFWSHTEWHWFQSLCDTPCTWEQTTSCLCSGLSMKNVLQVIEKEHDSKTDHECMVNCTVKADFENKCSYSLKITTIPVSCKFTYVCTWVTHPDTDGLKYFTNIQPLFTNGT